MSELTTRLRILFVRELKALEREIEMFPDDEPLWRTVPGVTNSAGNLAAHICGNLQHFVGHILGGTSYVRDREREFSRKSGTRAELIAEIRNTVQVIERVLPAIGDEVLSRDYPEAVGGVVVNTGWFLLHLGVHLAFHLGQAGYVRRIVMSDNRTSGPMAVSALAGA